MSDEPVAATPQPPQGNDLSPGEASVDTRPGGNDYVRPVEKDLQPAGSVLTPADFGWPEQVRIHLWDRVLDDQAIVTFGTIVAARELSTRDADPKVQAEAEVLARALQQKFESQTGAIESSYFYTYV